MSNAQSNIKIYSAWTVAVGSINLAVKIKYAGVVKLADTLDLGSNALWCAGSSPVTRTN